MAKVNSQVDWPQSSTQLDCPTVKLNWTDPSKLPTRLAYSKTQLDWPLVNYRLDSPTVEYPTDVFFKIFKFSAHCFRAWRHSQSSLIFYLGFIMTIVIVISSMRERKLYPVSVHLN